MIVFTDRVLEKLDTFIGRHPPERGGALMALPDSNLVVDFMPDPEGEMTGSSYVPSASLTSRVQQAERAHGLAFCGVVHSHPGSYNMPSGQDDVAFRHGLDINPHLARFIAPIITVDGQAERGSRCQQTIGPRARMTCYVAYRSTERAMPVMPVGDPAGPVAARSEPVSFWGRRRLARSAAAADPPRAPQAPDTGRACPNGSGGGHAGGSEPGVHDTAGDDHLIRDHSGKVRLLRTPIDVMPLSAEMEALRAGVERRFERPARAREGPLIELGGVWCLSESITFDGGDVMVIVPPTFPFTAPIIVQGAGAESHEVKFHWKMDYGTRPLSLAAAVIDHLGGLN